MNQFILGLEKILQGDYLNIIVKGMITTLELAVVAWILAMFIALILVVVRLTNNKMALFFTTVYISYHRNIPTLVQLMLWYFGISSLFPLTTQLWMAEHNSEFIFSFIALGLCQAAYFSEDIRSGMRAIPDGQNEAARALGLGYIRSMRYVIIPLGVRNALPSLLNHTVLLFKNTSLAMAVGVVELTYATREVENYTFLTFQSYLISTLFYLSFSLILMFVGALIAKRFNKVYAR